METFIGEHDEEMVVIDRGNGEFTSMTKAFYDEQIKAQEKK